MAREKVMAAVIRTGALQDSSSEAADLRRDAAEATVAVCSSVSSRSRFTGNSRNRSKSFDSSSIEGLRGRLADRNVFISSPRLARFGDSRNRYGVSRSDSRHFECRRDRQGNRKDRPTSRGRYSRVRDAETAEVVSSAKTSLLRG